MASPEASECPICRLPFSHASTTSRPACPFCNRTFGRVDGARRHSKNCPARGGRPLPPDVKRGRKSRACDACSRIKVLCNSKIPCQRCSSRNLACTYGRFCTDSTHQRASPRDGKRPQHSDSSSALRFLLNCTDPRANLVNDAMIAGEPERDPATPAVWNQPTLNSVVHDTIDPRLLSLGFLDPYVGMPSDYHDMYDPVYAGAMAFTMPAIPDDSLATQVLLLKADIRQVVDGQSDLGDIICLDSFQNFFTCANFRRLMAIFFRRRQLLAQMIHWPTFDPSKVDPGLLLAIALCGAAYSHNSEESAEHAHTARKLQQLAEKYIFRRLKQCPGGNDSRSELETCQAAYLIIILQISMEDGNTRRRAITKRQPALVHALRRLGMMSGKVSSSTHEADWQTFVYRESCIRLVTWAFFTDGLLALLCNVPPTTSVSEMSGELPCRAQLWDAECPASFEPEKNKGELVAQSLCMKSLIADLLDDDWEYATAPVYQRLSVFHLYAAIGGAYSAAIGPSASTILNSPS